MKNIGYEIIVKTRESLTVTKSGGIAICCKNDIMNHVKAIKSDSKYVQWVQIDRKLINCEKDMVLGAVYIPPENTRYSNVESFDEIQNEVTMINKEERFHICLAGDFNSHTGQLSDCIDIDEYVCEEAGLGEIMKNALNSETILSKLGLDKTRNSLDKHAPNRYGKRLIELCQVNSLFICNGRLGTDKNVGSITCLDWKSVKQNTFQAPHSGSLVDYFISSGCLLGYIDKFEILEFDPMLSDRHRGIKISFKDTLTISEAKQVVKNGTKTGMDKTVKRVKWDEERAETLVTLLENEVASIIQLENDIDLSQNINTIASKIKIMYFKLIESAGMKINKGYISKKGNQKRTKSWFNVKCKESRKSYEKAKTTYYANKSQSNHKNLKLRLHIYKQDIKRAKRDYQYNFFIKLRQTRSNDPKTYWKIINPKKTSDTLTNITVKQFKTYFEKLNKVDNVEEIPSEPQACEKINDAIRQILDADITEEEIRKAVKQTKNGKSAGPDGIINEFLKLSLPHLLPLWQKYFNRILKCNQVPDDWLIGLLVPIYKNKGDINDEGNYRGITLNSCLGKIFTSIINKRLTKLSETNDIIKINQAAYKDGHSTVDHIFTLHGIIQILLQRKKPLYCAFIDYEKAFDKYHGV